MTIAVSFKRCFGVSSLSGKVELQYTNEELMRARTVSRRTELSCGSRAVARRRFCCVPLAHVDEDRSQRLGLAGLAL